MKKINLVYFIFFCAAAFSQENFKNNQVKLEDGYPQATKQFFDFYGQYKLSEVKTAQLESGIDALQVYFGIAENTEHKFYWLALTNNDSLITLSSGFLLEKIASNVYKGSSKVTLGKDRPEYVKLAINLNENNNVLSYYWLNRSDKPIQNMEIIGIDKFKLGSKFPNLSFTSMSGHETNMSAYEGKIKVVNWWSIFCKPCIAEMPGLNELFKKYYNNENIVFVAVADNNASEVKNFLSKRDFRYEQFVTSDEAKVFFDLSYPKHFIIGIDGEIKFFLEGGGKETYKEIDSTLKKILKSK